MALTVSEEEGSYALCFYCWFLESFKCWLWSAWFNWHSCTVASLKHPAMNVYEEYGFLVTKLFGHRIISSTQYRWSDLWHYICYFVHSGEREVWWKEILNTPTHSHSSLSRYKTWEPNQSSVGWKKLQLMSLNLNGQKNVIQACWSWSA